MGNAQEFMQYMYDMLFDNDLYQKFPSNSEILSA